MACGSGCCGPPKDPSNETETISMEQIQNPDRNQPTCRQPVPGEAKNAGKADSCCGETEAREDCCKPVEAISAGRQRACCGGSPSEEAEDLKADDKAYLNKVSKEPKNESDTPSCCEGKIFPCCDVDCLERLALRECNTNSSGTTTLIPTCH